MASGLVAFFVGGSLSQRRIHSTFVFVSNLWPVLLKEPAGSTLYHVIFHKYIFVSNALVRHVSNVI